MEGALMNAQEADIILDACEEVFQSFCQTHGMRIKRNDHFEGINRVCEWTESGILKTISVEFTYADKPAFEIHIKAFNRIGFLLKRYGGFLGRVVPLRQWYSRLTEVELPRDKDRLSSLLEDAYRSLTAVGAESLRKA